MGLTGLPAVTGQPAPLTALVATDERPGADLSTSSVESVAVTVAAVPGARVLTVEDCLTLGFADLIQSFLVALNLLNVSTWELFLDLDSASGCRTVRVRAVNTAQQVAAMTTIPNFDAAFSACEELRIHSTGHGLSVSTPGDDLLHGVGAGAALLVAGLLAFVP